MRPPPPPPPRRGAERLTKPPPAALPSIPNLLENFLLNMPKTGMGLQAYVGFYNFVWLFVFISVLYGVGSCILGQTARLPGVADAAEQQIF